MEYDALVSIGVYPETAQMIVEWNESCAANAEAMGKPWGAIVQESGVCTEGRLRCWWRGVWK